MTRGHHSTHAGRAVPSVPQIRARLVLKTRCFGPMTTCEGRTYKGESDV